MEPRSKKARFGEVSEDAELQALDARTPMSTKTATTFWLGVFESRYKKASYLAARAAISRYMAVDLSKPTCNVFRQAEFHSSNDILDGVLKQAKASGEERAVEHKEAITADDLEKIRRYFDDVLDVGDPVKLTQFCWFHLSIHFALRSKEIQTTIRKSDIVFGQILKERNMQVFGEISWLRTAQVVSKAANTNATVACKNRVRWKHSRSFLPNYIQASSVSSSVASKEISPKASQRGFTVYESTPGPHRPRRHVATNKRSGSPFPKVHKSLSSSDKRRYLERFRLRRPSCMPPDRAQNPAKPRKLLQVIRKREASSRTCARRKNVQVARRRGFFLFFESSGNDHFVQPTRQRHSQPHDQHQE